MVAMPNEVACMIFKKIDSEFFSVLSVSGYFEVTIQCTVYRILGLILLGCHGQGKHSGK